MKFRLENSNLSDFSAGTDGYKPYAAKYSKPVSKIYVAPSVFSVRSNGLTARWYRNVNRTTTTLVDGDAYYQGVLPLVKFWYENGIPPTVGPVTSLSNWALKLSGYFQPHKDGDYKFYLGGSGEIHKFTVNATDLLSGNVKILAENLLQHVETSAVTLTANTWYDIEIIYKSFSAIESPAGLVVLWQNTDTTLMKEKLVLSAGVTDGDSGPPADGSMPIAYSEMSNITNIELSQSKGEISKLRLTIPITTNSASYYPTGYAYREYDDAYFDVSNTANAFKKFYMLQFKTGYVNSAGNNELVSRFVGQIRDWKIDYSGGLATLSIDAFDYGVFLRDSVNKEAPTSIDYIAAGYMKSIAGHVNGETKPRAYDGWNLHKAAENVLMNSYVDPFLFTYKHIYTDRNNNSTAGNHYIYGIDLSSPNYLPVGENYGNPYYVSGDQDESDDEYVYGINVGEKYYDVLDKILEPYAMNWGFTDSGYPYIRAYNVPTNTIDDRDADVTYGGTWFNSLDVNAFKATYKSTNTISASASANAVGSRFVALVRVGPNNGNTDTSVPTIITRVRSGKTIVSQKTFNLYNSTPRAYYDGVDDALGYNPCYLNIGDNLTYDTYSLSIVSTSNTHSVHFDGFFAYSQDLDNPYVRLKTGDASTPASVVELSVDNPSSYLRNESVVIGRRLGTRVAEGDQKIFDVVNPNNPIFEHVVSRTLDVNSIYKSTASNFVGRPLTTFIFDPAITDQDQADFLSFGFVDEYRRNKKLPSITILNNPLIEVGDCLALKDERHSVVTYNDKFWVDGITTTINRNQHLMRIETSPIRPVTSWFAKPDPDLSNFNNQPFQNISISNAGMICRLSSSINSANTEIIVDRVVDSAPAAGYLQLFKLDWGATVKYGDTSWRKKQPVMYQYAEIVKYYSKSTSGVNPGKFYLHDTNPLGKSRGLQGTLQGSGFGDSSWPIGSIVLAAWDQYTQDGMGISPVVHFDLLASGDVKCIVEAVSAYEGNTAIDIDNLSWNGQGDVLDADRSFTWGEDRIFTWGGLDNVGQWNLRANDPTLKKHAGVFLSEQTKIVPIYDNTPHGNNFQANTYRYVLPYVKSRLKFILTQSDGTRYTKISDEVMLTRRGRIGAVDFSFEYASSDGLHYYSGYTGSQGPTKVADADVTGPRIPLTGNPGGFFEVFFDGNTNNRQGMRYSIVDIGVLNPNYNQFTRNGVDASVDEHYLRYYGGIFKGIIRTVAHLKKSGPLVKYWFMSDNEDMVIFDQEKMNLVFNTSIAGKYVGFFNPQSIDPALTWISSDARLAMNTYFEEEAGSDDYFWMTNVVFPSGYLIDKSGRKALQHGMLDPYLDAIARLGQNPDDLLSVQKNRGVYLTPNELNAESSIRGNHILWEDETVATALSGAPYVSHSDWYVDGVAEEIYLPEKYQLHYRITRSDLGT